MRLMLYWRHSKDELSKGVFMKKIALVLVVLSATYADLNAQNPATSHVFPQVADGLLSNGTAYFSTIVAANVGTQAANCTIKLNGAVASHIAGSATMTIAPNGGVAVKNTALADNAAFLPLATGYGTLTCDRPVAAQVGYFYLAPTLPTLNFLGSATVFSSPPTTRAELFVTNTVGFRSAVAIANDTDTTGQYQITIVNESGQTVVTTNISVPGRSSVAKFFDELVQLPANFGGGAIISGSASTPFSAVGLLFNGSSFLSVAAVPFP
jgi:hypothetical protein